jgi:hypothetical protein
MLDLTPPLSFSEASVWKTLDTTPQRVLSTQITVQQWRDAGWQRERLMKAVRRLKRPHLRPARSVTRASRAPCA